MPIDTTKTGAAIAAHRQRMNLSQQGLAGLMNVTHQAVSKWEKGLALPDTETLLALAKLFSVSMEDLLLGALPAEEQPEPVLEAEEPAEETEAASAEWEQLDFGSVMNMLPFVSAKVADQLFRHCFRSAKPDAGQLVAIAPFVSTHALVDCIGEHPLTDCSPEMLCALAPFLPTQLTDQLILGLNGPIPPHMVQTLMPFASAKVVDQMVLDKLGVKREKHALGGANAPLSEAARQEIDVIHQRISERLQKLNADKHENPRARMLRRAVEQQNTDLIAQLYEYVIELDPKAQLTMCECLIQKGYYNLLGEIVEDLAEETLPDLLDKAFEINNPELLHIISEHI